MTVLVAADLDRTLIYSARAAGAVEPADLVCVEIYDGRPASFLTRTAAAELGLLGKSVGVVPVTTRTVAQLERVRLPGRPARYAVAANGGVLLVDGQRDDAWTAFVAAALRESAPLAQVHARLLEMCRPEWTQALRIAEDLFCYAVVDRSALPEAFLSEVTAWAAERGWRTSLQGRKLYWVPAALTKSAAVSEIARRTRAHDVLAAGDSLLDIDLLERADAGIHPAHGEIFDSGWSVPHVQQTASSGARAGEEIAIWLRAHADQAATSLRCQPPARR